MAVGAIPNGAGRKRSRTNLGATREGIMLSLTEVSNCIFTGSNHSKFGWMVKKLLVRGDNWSALAFGRFALRALAAKGK